MTTLLTADDIDQIVEGIELFIVEGYDELQEVWQPYIDKLNALKRLLPLAHEQPPSVAAVDPVGERVTE